MTTPGQNTGAEVALDALAAIRQKHAQNADLNRDIVGEVAIEIMWSRGMSTKEIAHRMGISPNALHVRINRMRRRGCHLPYRHKGYSRFPDQANDDIPSDANR